MQRLVTLGGDGQDVDAVWVEGADCFDRTGCRLRYRRSRDGGRSFDPPATLAHGSAPGFTQVARRGSLVVVAWTNEETGAVLVRRSTNGGTTFARAQKLGLTAYRPFGDGRRDGAVSLAIGGGVVYVLWSRDYGTLKLRRSPDAGAAWLARQTLSSDVNDGFDADVAAGPDDALVAFNSVFDGPVTIDSTDDGQHWSSPARVQRADGDSGEGLTPVLAQIDDGTSLAAFADIAPHGSRDEIEVVETSDRGATWPRGFVAGGSPARFFNPTGLVRLDRVVVAYYRVGKHYRTNEYVQFADVLASVSHLERRRR